MTAADITRRIFFIFESFDSNKLGIIFSLFIHLLILLFAVGLPDIFKPKPIVLPNIIPIEIINVAEITSFSEKKVEVDEKPVEKKIIKQKKFNSSENTEIKKIEMQKKPEVVKKETPEINTKKPIEINEKTKPKKLKKEKFESLEISQKIETLQTSKIKPKLKPKPKKLVPNNTLSDVQKIPKPQPKPEPEFSIASMLKDLRNEKSNNLQNQKDIKEEKDISNSDLEKNNKESQMLSISEIDLLKQQLSSCWNAPAGVVLEKGMIVKISTKIRQNRRVIENSVRIVDTNISKSNPFYGPITESTMRTLLNPECIPLKLPADKYSLWKDLTITFDYSIMKGYSE
tara:strand:+ start:471 stop:1499 length:1029 start_codon:yes stop_codon:yes gene_type:complete